MNYSMFTDSDSPVMLIDKHIGYDEADGYGVMGGDFSRELLTLCEKPTTKQVHIWINSVGGSVMDAYAIIGAIQKCGKPVHTHNLGMAASSALNIFLAGTTRHMMDYAQIMTHEVSGGGSNSENWNNSIATLIGSRTGKAVEDVLTLMAAVTYMDAKTALENGFCDVVENSGVNVEVSSTTNAVKMFEQFKPAFEAVMNKANQSNLPNMKSVTNKLGLIEGASEAIILDAVNKLEQRAVSAESELATNKDTLKTVQDKLNAFESEVTAREKAESQNKAKALIEKHQTEGRLPVGETDEVKEVLNSWTEMAVTNYASAEKMLAVLPINKQGVKIDQPNGEESGISMAAELAKIKNQTTKP